MSTITYKCPNCDADLIFRPATGDFGCEFCNSSYTEQQLKELAKTDSLIDEQKEQAASEFSEHAVVYSCPSCGAELVTDDTTAATFCFYCHNPVIMKGRLTGEMAPDSVIPFAIPKEKVKAKLIEWCGSKKFIDKAFCDDMQIEKLTGVYFPFWIVDSDVSATLSARSASLRVWVLGDIEYTETSTYALTRAGNIDLNDITLTALNRQDAELLNGVYPYDMSKLKPFSMSFLSGFLAEKRNIDRASLEANVKNTVYSTADELLSNTLGGYGSVSGKSVSVNEKSSTWKYALLPAWMMTYRYKGELYYFAMNGQTGKVAGRVPVSRPKLNKLFWGITAGAAIVMAVIGGIL